MTSPCEHGVLEPHVNDELKHESSLDIMLPLQRTARHGYVTHFSHLAQAFFSLTGASITCFWVIFILPWHLPCLFYSCTPVEM
jgi:hypothetical protein